ncbi:MAG: type III secretion inner membrane ring lipoprotein SctJ [Pseudomonadota bacterium]
MTLLELVHVRRFAAFILFILIVTTVSACKENLYTGLSEREANEMLAILMSQGIEAGRTVEKDETNTILVEKSAIPKAVDVLNKAGYPKQQFTNMGEVFQGNGFILSPTEERARFIFAMSEELSRTISDIDGVLTARIHVVLPRNNPLKRDTTPSSASVFIRHSSKADLDGLLPKIKMLVASSIEGLTYDKVSVVMTIADPIFEDLSVTSIDRAQSSFDFMTLRTLVEALFGLAALIGLLIIFWIRRPSPAVVEKPSEPMESKPRLRRVS